MKKKFFVLQCGCIVKQCLILVRMTILFYPVWTRMTREKIAYDQNEVSLLMIIIIALVMPIWKLHE